jgi:hypothetical protein
VYLNALLVQIVHKFQILFRREEPDLVRIVILEQLSREAINMRNGNYSAEVKESFRTLVCVEPSIRFANHFVQSDLHINLVHSLKENNFFMIDVWNEIEKFPSNVKAIEVQEYLEDIVTRSKISHLFFDLNCTRDSELFGLNWLTSLKKRYNLKIVFFAPDFSLKKYLFWNDIADIFVMSRPSKLQELPQSIIHKILIQPGIPYSTHLLMGAEKSIDFAFVGSPSRDRKFFMAGLSKFPIKTQIEFAGKTEGRFTQYSDYIEVISRARMTFSNGYINPRDSLIAGRFIESVLVGTLVFYENCPDLEFFFRPGLHYVSVKSRREFENKIMQLNADEELRKGIADCARNHYLQKYGSTIMYKHILEL